MGDIRWFSEGQLNVSYNCVDRHVLNGRGDDVAIIWEADEPGHSRSITFRELQTEVCKVANVLTYHGVRKGDTVAIYMPMIPDLAYVMLACTRIGAVHRFVQQQQQQQQQQRRAVRHAVLCASCDAFVCTVLMSFIPLSALAALCLRVSQPIHYATASWTRAASGWSRLMRASAAAAPSR
ncbi:hypothetical protein EON62_02165 [archaeon]|nr:MAG: hypothetical protein EON62_02165 [archaeon]